MEIGIIPLTHQVAVVAGAAKDAIFDSPGRGRATEGLPAGQVFAVEELHPAVAVYPHLRHEPWRFGVAPQHSPGVWREDLRNIIAICGVTMDRLANHSSVMSGHGNVAETGV